MPPPWFGQISAQFLTKPIDLAKYSVGLIFNQAMNFYKSPQCKLATTIILRNACRNSIYEKCTTSVQYFCNRSENWNSINNFAILNCLLSCFSMFARHLRSRLIVTLSRRMTFTLTQRKEVNCQFICRKKIIICKIIFSVFSTIQVFWLSTMVTLTDNVAVHIPISTGISAQVIFAVLYTLIFTMYNTTSHIFPSWCTRKKRVPTTSVSQIGALLSWQTLFSTHLNFSASMQCWGSEFTKSCDGFSSQLTTFVNHVLEPNTHNRWRHAFLWGFPVTPISGENQSQGSTLEIPGIPYPLGHVTSQYYISIIYPWRPSY